MWQSLCRAMGREDLLSDERFVRGAARHENAAALYEEIAKWTREHTKHEVMAILGKAGVPCSAVLATRDLFEDPHLQARGFVQRVQHPARGNVPLLGWPARLSKSAVPIRPAPLLGQHTCEVLREDLALGEAELERLLEQGVVAQD
jgi:formyl-CoA transferase